MGFRSFLRRLTNRGIAESLRRAHVLLLDPDQLLEPPEVLEKMPGTRILVVAPHADDETLGCGGTLYKHHLAHDHVTAVFMTDGSKGSAFVKELSEKAVVELRENEARAAALELGIDECIFLRNPDMFLRCTSETIGQIERYMTLKQPDLIYLPSPFDTHRDHQQTCAIAAQVLARYTRPLVVCLYEVWAPLPANCAVVIDLERKVRAIRNYRSQMDERELYVTGATALAHYRAVTCTPGQYAGSVECFLRLERQEFVRFAKAMA